MSKKITALALVVLMSACAQRKDLEADKAEIRGLITTMERANNEGDVAAWVEAFDDDAIYLPPFGEVVTTREGLVDVAERGFSNWIPQVLIAPQSIRIHDDWADVYSEVRGISILATGGDTVDVNVKQLVIYRRRADGWKISRMMINPNE